MLIGDKFRRRLPYGQIFYPGYKHFGADLELGYLAKKTGRFYFCEQAGVKHYHPTASRLCPEDQTHIHARRFLKADIELLNDRLQKGICWGV